MQHFQGKAGQSILRDSVLLKNIGSLRHDPYQKQRDSYYPTSPIMSLE
jgi:hypothetical protein